jgi:hypothetical protein
MRFCNRSLIFLGLSFYVIIVFIRASLLWNVTAQSVTRIRLSTVIFVLHHHHIRTNSGARPASHPVGTPSSLPGSKAAETLSWTFTSISSSRGLQFVELRYDQFCLSTVLGVWRRDWGIHDSRWCSPTRSSLRIRCLGKQGRGLFVVFQRQHHWIVFAAGTKSLVYKREECAVKLGTAL